MLILIFVLGEERFGIPAAQVEEVTLPVRIFPFPDAPPIVEGLIYYRGSAVPLVNLRSRFGISPTERHDQERFIIARTGSGRVTLRATDVLDVSEIDPGDLEEAPQIGTLQSRYIAAIAKLPDGLILIHDLETLLDAGETAWLAGSQIDAQETLE